MNLHGPVRAAVSAGEGTATLTVSFDAWPEGLVAPSTHQVEVVRPKGAAKPEPVSPRLVKTLVHPVRRANVLTVRFSDDGSRLFAAGYPSGVVHLWDTGTWKELRRIETPLGMRSASYAVLSPDWKTLYVPVEGDKFVRGEKDGKRVGWREYNGSVRIWDLTTGKELPPIPTPGRGPLRAVLSPDGKAMILSMGRNGSAARQGDSVTEIWDLSTRTGRTLCEGYGQVAYAPDGKTLLVFVHDHDTKTDTLRVFDAAGVKELARFDHKGEDDRYLSSPGYTPDGRAVFVQLGGKKGATPTLWFFDARTLTRTGELTGEPDPDGSGWFFMPQFTPDGKRMVALNGPGRVALYDLATRNRVRIWSVGQTVRLWWATLTRDGKRLLVGGQPKWDRAEFGDEPDPADLPQPRVYVFDLDSDSGKPAAELVAPHGYLGAVAVSPDGRTAALGTAGAVHLFDVK